MKGKILNSGLVLSSMLGYLEWGGGNKMFLIQGEIDVVAKLFSNPGSALHPFTVLPLLGQVLLCITLFQRRPSTVLTYLGLAGLGLLLVFMFIIGLLGSSMKTTLSVVPFLILAYLTLRHMHATRNAVGRSDPSAA